MGDGFGSLLLHLVVITPVCQYLLTSPKFPKPRNFLFAIAFLVAVALAGEVSDWQARPSNYYRVLEVDRTFTPTELKKAYREASLRWHPDKNQSPEAALQFQAVAQAYETLSDAEMRKVYERYGAAVAKDARTRAALASRGDGEALMAMAGFYVLWGVLTYLMTLGKARAQARTWSFVGMVVALFLEWQMMFGGWDPLASFFTRTTLLEKVSLVHSLYPPFMHGCILIAQFAYVDIDAVQLLLLQTVLNNQQEIHKLLQHVVQCVDKKNGSTVAAGVGAAVAESDSAVLTLAQRMKRQEASAQKALSDAQQKKGGFPSWLIMVGLYFVFNYLLK